MNINKINVNNSDSGYAHSIFDITEYNAGAKYEDLSTALADVPSNKQQGGMTVRYVDENINNYVQYRLLSNSFNTNINNWQGIDNEPIEDSKNIIESGGVFKKVALYTPNNSKIFNLIDKEKKDISSEIKISTTSGVPIKAVLDNRTAIYTSVKWSIALGLIVFKYQSLFINVENGSVLSICFMYDDGTFYNSFICPKIEGNSVFLDIPEDVSYLRMSLYRTEDRINNVDISDIIDTVLSTVKVYAISDRIIQKNNTCFNIWDEQVLYNKTISTSSHDIVFYNGIASKNYIPVYPNTQYYLRCPAIGNEIKSIYVFYYDINFTFIELFSVDN